MKTRLPLLAILALFTTVGLTGSAVRAQSSSPSDAGDSDTPAASEAKFVSVSSDYTGSPILLVEYPWTHHARPSVEVRMLGEDEPDDYRVRPLHFLNDFMTGEMNVAVFRCQLDAADTRRTKTTTRSEIEFKLIGDRNSLGKAAVCVCCDTPAPFDELKRVNRAAFGLLGPWAVDRRTLHLELPQQHFTKPGKMRVWLLRGDGIVWSEVIQWPGLEE